MIFPQEHLNSEAYYLYHPRRKTQKLNIKNVSQEPNLNKVISMY